MAKKNKKKKEKIIWYDDNSTIADMSNLPNAKKPTKDGDKKVGSTFKDKWNTYWSTVKLMLLPMTVVLGIIFVLYLLIMLITGGFGSCA